MHRIRPPRRVGAHRPAPAHPVPHLRRASPRSRHAEPRTTARRPPVRGCSGVSPARRPAPWEEALGDEPGPRLVGTRSGFPAPQSTHRHRRIPPPMSTREAGTTPSVRPRPQTGWTELAVAVLGYVALCVAVGQARRAQGDGDRDGRIARGDQAQAGGVVGLDRVGPEQLHAHLAQPVRAGVAVEGQRRAGRATGWSAHRRRPARPRGRGGPPRAPGRSRTRRAATHRPRRCRRSPPPRRPQPARGRA